MARKRNSTEEREKEDEAYGTAPAAPAPGTTPIDQPFRDEDIPSPSQKAVNDTLRSPFLAGNNHVVLPYLELQNGHDTIIAELKGLDATPQGASKGDGIITGNEIVGLSAEKIQALRQSLDRNGDGATTQTEIADAVALFRSVVNDVTITNEAVTALLNRVTTPAPEAPPTKHER